MLAHQVALPGLAQERRKVKGDSHRIDIPPRLRLVTQKEEFKRQPFTVGFQEGVDTPRVCGEESALIRRDCGEGSFRDLGQPEGPTFNVQPQGAIAEDFGIIVGWTRCSMP